MTEMRESAISVPGLTLGWRLQMALRHGGVSVQEMADQLGVRRQTLSRWTGDHGAPPKRAYITQWALATGVPVEWLETGHAAPIANPGDQMTTSGYLADPLPFPAFPVNTDTPSSHNVPWQVVASATGHERSPQPRGTDVKINEAYAIRSRPSSQPVSATEEMISASRVAA